MPVNRFWSSVGSVLAYLAGVGLLQYILVKVGTGFGLLTGSVAVLIGAVLTVIVPIVGTIYYIEWRWSWKGEHIGLGRSSGLAAGKWLLGLAGGAAGALVAHFASRAISGDPLAFSLAGLMSLPNFLPLILLLAQLFVTELVFRGASISRLQADLSPREVLMAAPLIPLIWFIITALFGYGRLPMGIESTSDVAATLFVILLFLRTDSVWLGAGARMGFLAAGAMLSLQITDQGALLVWGVAAMILLALEWSKQQRMPKRVQQRGRTIRGPWNGPH
ncbi:MAG TPA: CPBP family glutamic-type intramembrane protease [Symbiobacteriaceae bacterium]|nr:CPBP family glutamic-type intramembrane protease [Symbiobacteriaceae bacterium]